MKKMALVAMLVFTVTLTAEAARKKSSQNQPIAPRPASEPCVGYDCQDDQKSQSSDDTYVPGSGTYEGNDRDTGSDYINGMPY